MNQLFKENILKEREILRLRKETLRWYSDSKALHKYGYGFHYHTGDFLKDLEEHRKAELKMLRENDDLKIKVWNLNHRIDLLETENNLLKDELQTQKNMDLLNFELHREKNGHFHDFDKALWDVHEFKVEDEKSVRDWCSKNKNWEFANIEILYSNWPKYQEYKERLTRSGVLQVFVGDFVWNLKTCEIFHQKIILHNQNYEKVNHRLIFRGERHVFHKDKTSLLFEALNKYEQRVTLQQDDLMKKHNEILKLRQGFQTFESNKNFKHDNDVIE